jgi:CheY-like chemotaxis protein
MLERLLGAHIDIRMSLEPALEAILVDPDQMSQVIANLAVNARDAMPRGGALVITTSEREFAPSAEDLPPDAKAGRYVCVTVKDSGEGIRPEVLPRIFEPFFTTKGPGKGTGLGLATVFGIVKQHHGWITSASEPGHGATFEFFLPALPSEQVALVEAAPAKEARGGTETILLVEDDPAVRAVTRATLARHGYQVIDAPSGEEAGSLWRQHGRPISLLLTDLVMPGISGQELARQLKSEKPGLKVVFTSGYSGELAGRELELGASEAFVAKPCAAAKLLQVVRQVLDGAGSAPPPSHAR